MKKFPIDLSCLTEEEISQFQEDPYTLYNGDQEVALYLRYSSTGQSDQSIEGQLRDCRAFCKANHYRIVPLSAYPNPTLCGERCSFKPKDTPYLNR